MQASTYFVKIPSKVKIFLSIASLQRTTNDSCICCSVVWKMSSQMLGLKSRQQSRVYIFLKGWAFFLFWFFFFLFFLRVKVGGSWDDGAPVTTADKNFDCLSKLLFSKLLFNTSRSVDKPHESTYLPNYLSYLSYLPKARAIQSYDRSFLICRFSSD